MKTLITAASVLVLLLGPAQAAHSAQGAAPAAVSLQGMPSGPYTLDPSHASLNWKVSHFGLSHYTARFTRFDVNLNFDAQNPQNSTLEVSIDPTSIQTNYPWPQKEDFDATLANDAQWFNASQYPAITFRATGLTRTGPNTGTMTGDMTMLGQTHPVRMDVTLNGAYVKHPMAGDPALGFSAHGVLKRTDWGLAAYVPFVGDAVEFFVESEFHKKPEQ